MTVKELIDKLMDMREDAEVKLFDGEMVEYVNVQSVGYQVNNGQEITSVVVIE